MSCQSYTVKFFEKKEGMQVFWGIIKKNIDHCLQNFKNPLGFITVKKGRPQCIEETRVLQWNFMAYIISLQVDAKWQHISV